jgi:hypothetical protein
LGMPAASCSTEVFSACHCFDPWLRSRLGILERAGSEFGYDLMREKYGKILLVVPPSSKVAHYPSNYWYYWCKSYKQ